MRFPLLYLSPFLSVFALLAPALTQADIVLVDSGGGGDFNTIQAAVDVVPTGSVINVAPGEYQETIDFLDKELVIQSVDGPATTIVRPPFGTGFILKEGQTPASIISGFTIRDGQGYLIDGDFRGGAMFLDGAEPIVRNCVFEENRAGYAAAIYLKDAVIVIEDCEFIGNEADRYGGAVAGPASGVKVFRSYFEGNRAGVGDGVLHLAVGSVIEDCQFVNNHSRAGGAVNAGGTGANFTVIRCMFFDNSATQIHGGAIRVHEANMIVEDCVFVGNHAALDGGAVLAIDGADLTIRTSTFWENSAGRLGATTASYGSSIEVERSIFAGSPTRAAVYCSSGNGSSLECCAFWGNFANFEGCPDVIGVNGNFLGDPLFCDAEQGNFSLLDTSPCLPGQHPGGDSCGRIGAFGEGCAVADVPELVGSRSGSIEFLSQLPATDGIRFEVPPEFSNGVVEIFDLRGRKIAAEVIAGLQVSLSFVDRPVPSGVYFLRAVSPEGRALTARFVVTNR